MSDDLKIIIRDGTQEDQGFVASTWANGVYYGSECFRYLPEPVYYKWFPGIIAGILRNPELIIKIACDQDNPTWIAGCAAYDKEALYWVYVKEGFRNQGLGSLLIQKAEPLYFKSLMSMTRPGLILSEKRKLILKPIESGDLYERRSTQAPDHEA